LHEGGDCFKPRVDDKVCCGKAGTPSDAWQDDFRTCHDPTVDVAYPAYGTCELACKRDGAPYNEGDYYDDCKDPADGVATAAMTVAEPADTAAANKKSWCTCVATCLTCTGGAGGIGERPTGLTDLYSKFTAIHGTCVPPPASWNTPTAAAPAAPSPPPPPATVTATNFICAAAGPAGIPLTPFLKNFRLVMLVQRAARNLTHGVRVCCVCVCVCDQINVLYQRRQPACSASPRA